MAGLGEAPSGRIKLRNIFEFVDEARRMKINTVGLSTLIL